MKKITFKISMFALLFMLVSNVIKAQDAPKPAPATAPDSLIKKLVFSGYIQAQAQFTDSVGVKSYAGGNFPQYSDKRIMLRRALLKASYYANKNTQFVFQIDATDAGFAIRDLYIKYNIPCLKNIFTVTVGNQYRPFGYEVGFSPAESESPEKGRMSQILFNGDRDMGAMLTIQAPSTSFLSMFKIEAGLFNGTGPGTAAAPVTEFDKKKDFIGHLTVNKTILNNTLKLSGGVSYYNGAWLQTSKYVFTMGQVTPTVEGFIVNSSLNNVGSYSSAVRNYAGIDFQASLKSILGTTTIRAEFIEGQQPTVGNSGTGNPTALPTDTAKVTGGTYVRNFTGGYLYFVQNIGKTKHQIVVKYDWYDPNTKVDGNNVASVVGATKTYLTSTDLKYSTLGFGYAYLATENIKLSLYYDMVKNETSTGISKYSKDLRDNVLTARIQFKF